MPAIPLEDRILTETRTRRVRRITWNTWKGRADTRTVETKPAILLVDSDRMALDAIQEELGDEFTVHRAESVDEACSVLVASPRISAAALTVSDRFNNHAAMMRLRRQMADRPVILVLGFPQSALDYEPPRGFQPFGLVPKGEDPSRLVLLLRAAVEGR